LKICLRGGHPGSSIVRLFVIFLKRKHFVLLIFLSCIYLITKPSFEALIGNLYSLSQKKFKEFCLSLGLSSFSSFKKPYANIVQIQGPLPSTPKTGFKLN
jgi:hypothetical protein